MSWVIYDFSYMFIYLLWFCHRLPKWEIVRTYVIHLLGTYVIILCNWIILWKNALYLYLGRSRMCLILQETVFRDQVLKPYESVQETSWRSACHYSSTASHLSSLRSCFSLVAQQLLDSSLINRHLLGLWKIEFQFCFDSNPWLCVWAFFPHNPRNIKWLF